MNLFRYIFNNIAFAQAELTSSGKCNICMFRWRRGTMVPVNSKEALKYLVVVIVYGYGVVTKSDDAEICTRIRTDPKSFLWCSMNGKMSFVRKDRLRVVEGELASYNIVPVRVFCIDNDSDFNQIVTILLQKVYDDLKWTILLKPTRESSAAMLVLARRAIFPILGAALVLLAANVLISIHLNNKRQQLQSEVEVRNKAALRNSLTEIRQQELLASFAASFHTSRAVLCDQIARVVPYQVTLTSLEIEPLIERFESGKPLHSRENTVVICGNTPVAADIPSFLQKLSALEQCRNVRLINVEKDRGSNRLIFRIELLL